MCFFRKMASRKISVNLSRPKTLKGASLKNIGEQTPPELMVTYISSALSDKKIISDWKNSKEVKFPSSLVCERKREHKCEHISIY